MKVGDKVTTIAKGELAKVLLVGAGRATVWSVRIYRERKRSHALYPLKDTWLVDLAPNAENVTWAQGWDTEAAGALRAAIALQRSHE